MAENLSEHLKRFIVLLLNQINAHPSAGAILSSLKANTSFVASTKNNTTKIGNQVEIKRPLTNGMCNTPKKSPTIIQNDSPFKPSVSYDHKDTMSKKSSSKCIIPTKGNVIYRQEETPAYPIPTLAYIKSKVKNGQSVAIAYLKSQVEFLSELPPVSALSKVTPLQMAIRSIEPVIEKFIHRV